MSRLAPGYLLSSLQGAGQRLKTKDWRLETPVVGGCVRDQKAKRDPGPISDIFVDNVGIGLGAFFFSPRRQTPKNVIKKIEGKSVFLGGRLFCSLQIKTFRRASRLLLFVESLLISQFVVILFCVLWFWFLLLSLRNTPKREKKGDKKGIEIFVGCFEKESKEKRLFDMEFLRGHAVYCGCGCGVSVGVFEKINLNSPCRLNRATPRHLLEIGRREAGGGGPGFRK
jgi:hypothetical protein